MRSMAARGRRGRWWCWWRSCSPERTPPSTCTPAWRSARRRPSSTAARPSRASSTRRGCSTGPQAGTDVGAAKTSARRLPNGKYAIKGTKVFISGGDHDLAENIVHLVLARVEGAPPGTKGLSLFIVPKKKISAEGKVGGSNDVTVGSIEHKMGINGSATCVLNFGESDDWEGELVGTVENLGMSQMFRMMNGARIAVGIQG